MDRINLLGESKVFKKVLFEAKKIAQSSARVLIEGETGSGKEEIAKYIHHNSLRSDKAFVAINCAAMPAELLESEIFGHEKGAFTTAYRSYDGLVAEAKGGTLFLDEVAELELPLQAKLLRFIESGEYRKVGSSKISHADIRIISATHKDLKNQIVVKKFREDLYYRLSVIDLKVPPLRERGEDISLLAMSFLWDIACREGKQVHHIDNDAEKLISFYSWPGNIRELQNLIYKLVVLSVGETIDKNIVLQYLDLKNAMDNDNIVHIVNQESHMPRPLWQVEKDAIEGAIKYCQGNIVNAAALLQVSPSTIYRKRSI